MDAKAFFRLVSEMREQQKRYFKTKSQTALQESRRLEMQVDAEIERVNRIINPPVEQGDLFGSAREDCR